MPGILENLEMMYEGKCGSKKSMDEGCKKSVGEVCGKKPMGEGCGKKPMDEGCGKKAKCESSCKGPKCECTSTLDTLDMILL